MDLGYLDEQRRLGRGACGGRVSKHTNAPMSRSRGTLTATSQRSNCQVLSLLRLRHTVQVQQHYIHIRRKIKFVTQVVFNGETGDYSIHVQVYPGGPRLVATSPPLSPTASVYQPFREWI